MKVGGIKEIHSAGSVLLPWFGDCCFGSYGRLLFLYSVLGVALAPGANMRPQLCILGCSLCPEVIGWLPAHLESMGSDQLEGLQRNAVARPAPITLSLGTLRALCHKFWLFIWGAMTWVWLKARPWSFR